METKKNTRFSLANIVLLALFLAASFGLQACESTGDSSDNALSFNGITNSFEEPQFDSELNQITSSEKEFKNCHKNHTGVVVFSNGSDETVSILIDKKHVGDVGPHSELKFVVSAGIHTIYREYPLWSSEAGLTRLCSFKLEECEVYYCGI